MRVGCVGTRMAASGHRHEGITGAYLGVSENAGKLKVRRKKWGPPSAAGRTRPKKRRPARLQGAKKMPLFTAAYPRDAGDLRRIRAEAAWHLAGRTVNQKSGPVHVNYRVLLVC